MHWTVKHITAGVVGFIGALVGTNVDNWSEETGANKLWKILPLHFIEALKPWFPYIVGFGAGALIFAFWDPMTAWFSRWYNSVNAKAVLLDREKKLESFREILRMAIRRTDQLRDEIPEALEGESDRLISSRLNEWNEALATIDRCQLWIDSGKTPREQRLLAEYFPTQSPLIFAPRLNADQQRNVRKFWDETARIDYIAPIVQQRIQADLDFVQNQLRSYGAIR